MIPWSADSAQLLLRSQHLTTLRSDVLVRSQMGEEGRSAYQSYYWKPMGDMTLPLCYGPLLVVCMRERLPDDLKHRAILIALPILAAATDLVENLCISQLISSFNQEGWDEQEGWGGRSPGVLERP